MSNESEETRKNFVRWLQHEETKAADNARDSAGFNGAHNDGGARHIQNTIDGWLDGYHCGMSKSPLATSTYADRAEQFIKENDPEWEQYLMLKKKFDE